MKEEKDSLETFTGNNVLTWRVKNPHVTDLVEGDYFEIQRALKSDFSDAQTINVVSMERGLDKSNYKFVDEDRDSWTGNNSNIQYLGKSTLLGAQKKHSLRSALAWIHALL